MQEKFAPISNELIYNYDSHGPAFGKNGGGDLFISDDCNNKKYSFCCFPSGYNRASGNKLVRNQESYKLFSGATDNYYFRVVDYEVFKVWYK